MTLRKEIKRTEGDQGKIFDILDRLDSSKTRAWKREDLIDIIQNGLKIDWDSAYDIYFAWTDYRFEY